MTDTPTPEAVAAILKDVTPAPWRVDGGPWNQIVWSGEENRVCFMAHSSGLNDARDIATARFIAWARNNVEALAADRDAQKARADAAEAEVKAVLDREAETQRRHDAKIETAEAKVARLVEAFNWQTKARAQHWLRRNMTAPEDAEVEALCEKYGYGAVMDAASRLWARKPYGSGAFYVGGCIGFKSDEEALAVLRGEGGNG